MAFEVLLSNCLTDGQGGTGAEGYRGRVASLEASVRYRSIDLEASMHRCSSSIVQSSRDVELEV